MTAMIANHLAAIFFFSGPLFYIGLLMAIDPTGIVRLSGWLVRVVRKIARRLREGPSHGVVASEDADVSRRLRRGVRLAGLALLLVAIVI
jgi:hypothetical protein